jgi:hypothetical protein
MQPVYPICSHIARALQAIELMRESGACSIFVFATFPTAYRQAALASFSRAALWMIRMADGFS